MISPGRHLLARRWRSSGAAAIGLALFQACAFAGPSTSAQRLPTNPSQGKVIIGRAACGSCHEIPYVPNAHGMAGPPLAHFARRAFIAGMLPNSPDNLAYWLRFPQKVVPGNAMPDSGLNGSEARDAAAYLESLR
ncbi:MAG TPA: c-type cytochrome [Rhizomicrobium sp.]